MRTTSGRERVDVTTDESMTTSRSLAFRRDPSSACRPSRTYRMGRVYGERGAPALPTTSDLRIVPDPSSTTRQDEIIPNVKTYVAADPASPVHPRAHRGAGRESVNASGRLRDVIGPHAPKADHEDNDAGSWRNARVIAQPTPPVTPPVWRRGRSRAVTRPAPIRALREEISVSGRLTRVALRAGSLVVKSSRVRREDTGCRQMLARSRTICTGWRATSSAASRCHG